MNFQVQVYIFSFSGAGVISSLQEQASKAEHMPTVYVDWAACLPKDTDRLPNQPIQIRYHDPEEEIALGAGSQSLDHMVNPNGTCRATKVQVEEGLQTPQHTQTFLLTRRCLLKLL